MSENFHQHWDRVVKPYTRHSLEELLPIATRVGIDAAQMEQVDWLRRSLTHRREGQPLGQSWDQLAAGGQYYYQYHLARILTREALARGSEEPVAGRISLCWQRASDKARVSSFVQAQLPELLAAVRRPPHMPDDVVVHKAFFAVLWVVDEYYPLSAEEMVRWMAQSLGTGP